MGLISYFLNSLLESEVVMPKRIPANPLDFHYVMPCLLLITRTKKDEKKLNEVSRKRPTFDVLFVH